MKRALSKSALALLALCGLASLGILIGLWRAKACPADSGILMPVGPWQHDAGKLPSGSHLAHTFQLRNTSESSVRVDVQKSCGCTSVDLSANPVPPRQAIKINVKQFIPLSVAGKQGARILVTAEEDRESRVMFEVWGDFYRPLRVVPPTLLIDVPRGDRVSENVVLQKDPSVDLSPGQLTFSITPGFLKVSPLHDDVRWPLRLQITGTPPADATRVILGNLKICVPSNHEEANDLDVPIRIEIKS